MRIIMKKIIVVGGGTAGWITALKCRLQYPLYKIDLIESEEIGILGAGEGTTPHIISFLDEINIPVSDLVKNCKATIKCGIDFIDWNGVGTKFFHAFPNDSSITISEENQLFLSILSNTDIDSYCLATKLSRNHKVPFSPINNKNSIFDNPILSFESYTGWSLHFDARLLADCLRKQGESRGINRIEGRVDVSKTKTDKQGYISSITLEDGTEHHLDFLFDCTGFARLFIGKYFKSEWVSYTDYLTLDTATPFFIEHDNDVAPKTDAIAMKYGWVWKIPVEGRYGCGYVFDSKFINEEQAIQEVQEYFGMKNMDFRKSFKFQAGTFKDILFKNCLAVGLSQGFIEPLEATSIWNSLNTLHKFLQNDGINNRSEYFIRNFNKDRYTSNNNIMEFIYFHYLTKRRDTEFWKQFETCKLESLNEIIDILRNSLFSSLENNMEWENYNWVAVGNPLDTFENNCYEGRFIDYELNEMLQERVAMEHNQNNIMKICETHKDFLEYLKKY